MDIIEILDVDLATNSLFDALYFCVLNFISKFIIGRLYFPESYLKNSSLLSTKKCAHIEYKVSCCPKNYNE